MKNLLQILFLTSLALLSCTSNKKAELTEKWKNEIVATELVFAEMAQKEDIPTAFQTFAANVVVVLRNKNLISSKEAMTQFYQKRGSNSGKESPT